MKTPFIGSPSAFMNFWLYWLCFFGIIFLRYLLVAGTTYFWLDSLKNQRIERKSLGLHFQDLKVPSIQNDMSLSVLATVVLAFIGAWAMTIYNLGFTRLYTDFSRYGIGYLALSFFGILILQDTCFYFIHRLLHNPVLFEHLHSGHHYSKKPTPWTSFALDPPEALLQGIFLLVIVFVLPIHIIVLAFWLLTMTFWAVLNHLGFELFESSLARHWLGKWLIGSTYHSIHHHKYGVHYGLYFTFWDRLLDTYDSNYENRFDSFLK